jgi:hypothetical protein
MPVKRRHNKRREDLSEEAEQWLRGKNDGLGFFPYSLTDHANVKKILATPDVQ